MAVMIRLMRQGTKGQPQFLVVAVDKEKKRDGGHLAKLGWYYPSAVQPKDKIRLNRDAIQAWIAKGARVSETVGQLLKIQTK